MEQTFREFEGSPLRRGHLKLGQKRADGKSIDVTSLFIEKDGRPWIGIVGEYHYVRDKKENWKEELAKIKAGGITVISTYVFWIYHEEEEGVFDFTGDRDLRCFVKLCAAESLDVILRIGPWCHGECRNGGLPDWVLKKPFPVRDNTPEYLELAGNWYARIFDEVKGLFYEDGGPVIGIQIENELVDRPEHLGKLKELAKKAGFSVPLWTVTGWNRLYGAEFPPDEFLPVFGAYADAPWSDSTEKLPPSKHYTFDPTRNDTAIGMDLIREKDDGEWRLPYENYPFATCEIGSGLPFSHKRRPVISGMDAYALSLVKLGCGNNLIGYYMYHGGTNKYGKLSSLQESRATGFPNDYPVLNYDFHTCLTQYGETRKQYRLLNLLHLLINDFGDELARMEFTPQKHFVKETDRENLRCCLRTDGNSGFVFINHYQRFLPLKEITDVVIDTGTVRFPPIDISGETAFILPYHIPINGKLLKYSTAQLLCREGDTVFFAALPGITPEFLFDGHYLQMPSEGIGIRCESGTRLVTLPFKEALYLRKLNGKIYLGKNCDIYEIDGQIKAVQKGEQVYSRWTGTAFEEEKTGKPEKTAMFSMLPCDEPFPLPCPEELFLGEGKDLRWFLVSVDSPEGFVEIADTFDCAQLYTDGELVADIFYYGKPWRFPAALIFGKESYVVMSEPADEVYLEV